MKTLFALLLLAFTGCNTIYNHNLDCKLSTDDLRSEITNIFIEIGAKDIKYEPELKILKANVPSMNAYCSYVIRFKKDQIIMNITNSGGYGLDDSQFWIMRNLGKVSERIENVCKNKFVIIKVEN